MPRILVVPAVALWAFLAALLPTRAGAGPLSERILFASAPTRHAQIYTVRPDGRDLRNLVRLRGDCREPALCSRTGRVAFAVHERENWNLYRVDLDGGDLQRLTCNSSDDRHPSWSPDGERLDFKTHRWGQPELAIMRADGSGLRRLTWDQTVNRSPVWSPDGGRIAFVGWRQGSSDLYTVNPEGSTRSTRMTTNFYADVTPAWDPDGRQLVYGSSDHLRPFLAILGPDRRPRHLKEGTREASYPAWSPDGRRLLFTAGTGPSAALYTVPVAGGEPTAFPTRPPADVYDLVWQRCPLPW